MAILNGKPISFYLCTFQQIGEKIIMESGKADGKGVILELTEEEEQRFVSIVGLRVGMAICELIHGAVIKNGGDGTGLSYIYNPHKRLFTTS